MNWTDTSLPLMTSRLTVNVWPAEMETTRSEPSRKVAPSGMSADAGAATAARSTSDAIVATTGSRRRGLVIVDTTPSRVESS